MSLHDDLDVRHTLGCGSFGRVRLAVHRHTGEPMAVKSLRKSAVASTRQEASVVNERQGAVVV